MSTQAKLIASTSIPASLVRAVVRQLRGWESFKESAPDIVKHGIDAGFGDFIYYTDTIKFFRANRKAILAYASELADNVGEDLHTFIAGFRCLDHLNITLSEVDDAICDGKGECATQVQNAMAWLSAEQVARAYVDMTEG